MQLGAEQPFRFLIHDRDAKFSYAFGENLRSEGIKVIRTPVQAPNANAFAERWARTARSDLKGPKWSSGLSETLCNWCGLSAAG